MASVTIDEKVLSLGEGESVLEGLERAGVTVPNSCRSGVCQSCLMKAVEGAVPTKAQQGLKEALQAQGYFLSCVCVPEVDLTVALPGASLDFHASVLDSQDVGAAVRRIRLSIPEGFVWMAGQYITVLREDGIARSYSIASSPVDGYMELHVRRIAGGLLSPWLHDEVSVGDVLTIRGAFGDCVYTPGEQDAPLMLAGTGTGLAPLYGIAREAIRQGHRGSICLYHGALNAEGLYFREELEELAATSDCLFSYTPCVLHQGEVADDRIRVGALDAVVLAHDLDLVRGRAYLCGDPNLVKAMRKKLFLKGLSNRRILADAFVASAAVKIG